MKRFDAEAEFDFVRNMPVVNMTESETGEFVKHEESAAEIARLKRVIKKSASYMATDDFRAMCILDNEIDSWEEE